MKNILNIALCAVLCLSMSACSGDSSAPASASTPDVSSGSQSETSSSTDEPSEVVLVDEAGVKVIYTGMALTQYMPGAHMITIGLRLENGSDKEVTVLPMDSSVNGVMKIGVSGMPTTALAGKTAIGGFSFANLDGTGIESEDDFDLIESIEFKLSIVDENFKEIFKSSTINLP